MTKFKFGMTWLSVMLLAFTVGCGGGGDDTTTQGPGDGTGETASGEGSGDSNVNLGESGSPEGGSVTVPDQPLEAAKFMMYGLADGRPQDFYAALPPSYQSDIDGLISEFATKVDAELYDKSMSTLQKAVGILKDKKEFILAMIPDEGNAGPAPVKMAEVKKSYDAAVGVLSTIVNSDLSSVEKLKSMKGQSFMSGTAAKVMKQVIDISAGTEEDPVGNELANIKKATVSLVSEEGDKAVIKVVPADEDGITEEETWVKVEGRWIPEEMANEFKPGIEEAKQALAGFGSPPPEMKDQILGTLGSLDDILTRLDEAATKEEFQAAAMEASGQVGAMIMPFLMGGPGGPGPGGPDFGDPDTKPETEEKIGTEPETEAVKPEEEKEAEAEKAEAEAVESN